MRNLIKNILKESDFDWTNQVDAFELGDFDEDDVSFDDKDAKVYLGESGKITYNLTMEELIDYTYGGYEDWTLQTLITHNGDYTMNNYYDDYMDEDEINYVGGHFNQDQLNRLEKVLMYSDNKYGLRHKTVDDYVGDSSFSEIGDSLDKLYTGTWDWGDFCSEVLSAMGSAIEKNRWDVAGSEYQETLRNNGVDIDYFNDNDVSVEMSFPYKGDHNLSKVLSKIGLNDVTWQDVFYDEWDTSGADEEIQHSFDKMITKLEGVVNEETNS